eukprot:1150287-Pelagomonas_calceolata.AAC.1
MMLTATGAKLVPAALSSPGAMLLTAIHTICVHASFRPRMQTAMAPQLHPCAQVCFSPDGRLLLSASFDKSVKLWDGVRGTFLATLRAHVGPVYQVRLCTACLLVCQTCKGGVLAVWLGCAVQGVSTLSLPSLPPPHVTLTVAWSSDSRMVVSASKDSTLKVSFAAMLRAAKWELLEQASCFAVIFQYSYAISTCHTLALAGQLWDVRTRKLKVDLPGHADEVRQDFELLLYPRGAIRFPSDAVAGLPSYTALSLLKVTCFIPPFQSCPHSCPQFWDALIKHPIWCFAWTGAQMAPAWPQVEKTMSSSSGGIKWRPPILTYKSMRAVQTHGFLRVYIRGCCIGTR